MEYSCIGLNHLPDEILLHIFQNLNNIEVLYSFHGINQRLNQIVHDRSFTTHLTFARWSSNHFFDLFSSNMMLNRFCLQILPSIHENIQRLDLDSSSMEDVLRVANYPNLHTLGLYNIDEKSAECLTDQTLSSIFKKQIKTLFITIYNNDDNHKAMTLSVAKICDKIFNVFTDLTTFVLNESWYKTRVQLTFDNPFFPNIRCSTLLKLIIRVEIFDDCLYLLDGRYDQLHTFHVDLVKISFPDGSINQDHLPNLKCFSLSCKRETFDYEIAVLPLLYRMSYLEELDLCLKVRGSNTLIDGKHLKTKILKHMPRLNQFTFFIQSSNYIRNGISIPSTEDIQKTFIDFPNNNIISHVDFFPNFERSQCHIYSYPFLMRYYTGISNSFPGGLFEHVRAVSLYDERPFEHEFFLRIQKSFPFMEELSLVNRTAQNRKQSNQSNSHNQNSSLIEYTSLCKLSIVGVHDDYVEEFLLDTKTYFQNNLILLVNYECLERVTHDFSRDATRTNCGKINAYNRSICVCPTYKFGSRCFVKDTKCELNDNKICNNSDQCIRSVLNRQTLEPYTCFHSKGLHGDRCEHEENKIYLSFEKNFHSLETIFIHFIKTEKTFILKRTRTSKKKTSMKESIIISWSDPSNRILIENMKKNYYFIDSQDFPCDNLVVVYLLGSSITTLIIIFLFPLKFWIHIFAQISQISNGSFLNIQCTLLDYFLRIFIHIDQWLNACVACERAITVVEGARFSKKKSKKVTKFIILLFLILNIFTFIHEPLYRHLIDEIDEDKNEKRIWCVDNYSSKLQIYNSVITTFQFFASFIINFISAFILIAQEPRRQSITQRQQSFKDIKRKLSST
ncbi:unnamed protein product [Adineta steineri]|uniref:F-box domain-containing protein n=1 Tax=Adineta steineri TaxID=433720 RepID=A0A814P4W1_9BILA|nr:unnamed protein product [Adineta steineri]